MMLNRSRSTVTPLGPTNPPPDANPPSHDVGDDDLNDFNFENNHDDDLNLQITHALQEQAALENDEHLSQAASVSSGNLLGNQITSSTTAPTHLTGNRLQVFNRLATRTHLDDESQSLGRFMCSFESQDEQFLACMTTVLAVHQDVSSIRDEIIEAIRRNSFPGEASSPERVTWKGDGAELKQCMRLLATQTILSGNLQAYTARVDPLGGTDQLPLGLYAKVMTSMLSHPSEWKNRVLPPVHSGTNANVPVLDTVIVKLYQKERGLIGGRVRVREEILQEVDHLQTSRYAWLKLTVLPAIQRMQAIHWGLNFAEYEGRSFWNVVDRQLAFLRSQTTRYRYAFFLLVLQFDLERIDGTKTFEELRGSTNFSLPTEAQIQTTMDDLNTTFGQVVQPDEEAYTVLPEPATPI
ncbi:uncharacterized protein MELLADRAFT_86232 [Melampsora larici-populina 98AG31]|uniref:Uncharacterized protein n=1 Tax=Melampsora larici-populina (strain 98AG31 / pathotype 3-4-7) TaxID=747676 RepID=F4RL08_MELLP|nr:uncharacterized protein MELLADRAFT_86232 [Melampsora larici-populina 98AG31]EGG06944.1 hypothetical protein MELLADRAFT_86232 [Melampsora larici-populina 98AG31]